MPPSAKTSAVVYRESFHSALLYQHAAIILFPQTNNAGSFPIRLSCPSKQMTFMTLQLQAALLSCRGLFPHNERTRSTKYTGNTQE